MTLPPRRRAGTRCKFGGELTRLYYLNVAPYAARPGFSFFNVWDFLNDAPMSESGTFDPTTGIPTAGRQDNREDLWGFFVQDDWKATPQLTFNMGLRYSYFGPLDSKEGNLYHVQFGTGADMLTGMTIQRGGGLWNPQHLNLGPQFGFTYSPERFKQRFVMRGGYRIELQPGRDRHIVAGLLQPGPGSLTQLHHEHAGLAQSGDRLCDPWRRALAVRISAEPEYNCQFWLERVADDRARLA